MHGRRFSNMEAFEESLRRDQGLRCEPHRPPAHKGCEFEWKCRCDGKSVFVKSTPHKCVFNVEVERCRENREHKKR